MENFKINGIDLNFAYILSLFDNDNEEESTILDHLYNCRFDGFWMTSCNSYNNNERVTYNQNYVLSFDQNDIFITNFDLMNYENKFYKFQDKYTFKSVKAAIKAFIKLITK